MRLLITTQAVDLDDPVLGFFHRWIAELSKHCESIHVICLKEGRHELPSNVFVHSLGKECGRSRVKYIVRFYRYIWKYRKEYDSVFVHMNSEYAVLGGVLWRVWGKRIVLWRNHKLKGITTSIGARLANVVCYTSPSAFVAKFKNAVQMPIGIDTEFFSPAQSAAPERTILFLGRLDPVKKVEEFVRALDVLHEENIPFVATIVGDPTDERSDYAHDVRNLASHLALEGAVSMRTGVPQDAARDLFRNHSIYVNLTPSGSFDKTIGEAMACGCLVVAGNEVARDVLSKESFVDTDSVESIARGIQSALKMPIQTRAAFVESGRAWVVREHSLSLLAARLIGILAS